jgi:hypothetical protein
MYAATSAGGYSSSERAIVFHHLTVALAGLNPTHASTPPWVLVPRSSTDPCLSPRALSRPPGNVTFGPSHHHGADLIGNPYSRP